MSFDIWNDESMDLAWQDLLSDEPEDYVVTDEQINKLF